MFKNMVPYLVGLLVDFYFLPFLIKDTGSAMLVLLLVIPIITMCIAYFYGKKQGFQIIFPLITMLLFLPSVYLFYNESAMLYVLVYGAISFLMMYIGSRISRN